MIAPLFIPAWQMSMRQPAYGQQQDSWGT